MTEGGSVTVTVAFTNRNGFAPATAVTLSVQAPEGMTAQPVGAVTSASVAPGRTFSADFELTLTGTVADLVTRVPAGATYRSGISAGSPTGTAKASVRLMAATGVLDPYRTVSFNDAVFGQSGVALAIEGAGADLWAGTNQFGAIHRAGVFGAASSATVKVVSQDSTGGWARAGLIVRNDLSADGSPGYVNLAVTPSNGCVLSWDSGQDGTFDSIKMGGSFTAPVFLRLTRAGSAYTGEASTDGTTWTTVGTATPGGTADTQDVGVFMTAANGWTGTRGIAEFQDFTVS